MLSVILLSTLMMLSNPNVIRHLICDLRDTVNWGRKCLVDFYAGNTQLVSLDQSNNTGDIYVKMDGSVLENKSSLRRWGCLSVLNWIGTLTIPLLLKLAPGKLEPWFGCSLCSLDFQVALYLYKSTPWPCLGYSCHV